jgi:acyl carrier protein
MEQEGDIEERLRTLWQAVLGEPGAITEGSNFFQLGGHSMYGARLMAQVAQEFGVDVPIELIFREPVFGRFVTQVRELVTGRAADAVLMGATVAPLTDQQQVLMGVEQLFGVSPANTVTIAVELGVRPDPAVLTAALQSVVDRHAALRTVFPGGAVASEQTVHPVGELRVVVDVVDVCTLAAARREVLRGHLVPFDLARGPLVRGRLLRRDDAPAVLVLHLHHLVVDGASLEILLPELAAAYGALAEGPQPSQPDATSYLDYAVWHAARRAQLRAASAPYWHDVVRDLATDPTRVLVPRPPTAARFVRSTVQLDAHEATALRGWARDQGATEFTAVAAATAAAVHLSTGARWIGLGTLLENRSHQAFQQTVGPFATSTLIALEVGDSTTPAELVAAVAAQLTQLRRWADLPLDVLVESMTAELEVPPAELIDLVLTVEHRVELDRAALPMRLIADDARTLLPGTPGRQRNVVVRPLADRGLAFVVEHADEPAEAEWISDLSGALESGLVAFARHPHSPVGDAWTIGRVA